jgi:hypothetical protein
MELSGQSALPGEYIGPFDKLRAGSSAPNDGASDDKGWGWNDQGDGVHRKPDP